MEKDGKRAAVPEPRPGVSRRGFLIGSAAAGFALAAGPVSAAAILTDTGGIETGDLRVPASGGAVIPAYRAKPAEAKAAPLVLVVHEIFGLHEYIRDVCRRLAKAGYCAVAPDLFFRQGEVAKMTDIDQVRALVSRVADAQVLGDLDSVRSFATGQPGVDAKRTGVTGFCWGGRITWLYAAHVPKLKAGAAWYGRLVGDTDELHPRNPVDVAASLKVPVLGLYGGADTGIPLSSVEQMRKALATGTSGSEIVVYADAPHGFHADYRPMYREAAAIEAWERMLAWFGRKGL
jgi:carboxymethylenebutenolidase